MRPEDVREIRGAMTKEHSVPREKPKRIELVSTFNNTSPAERHGNSGARAFSDPSGA